MIADKDTEQNNTRAAAYLFAAWVIALSATLAVLFIGEVLGQAPCNLCWFQRTFMFPLAVILSIAVWKVDLFIWRYAAPLAILGGAVALYHSLLYAGIVPAPIVPCTASGPSCTDDAMLIFGLPIPFLSLLMFSAILALLFQLRRISK
jgi:disulfide bond formation protein DsbB